MFLMLLADFWASGPIQIDRASYFAPEINWRCRHSPSEGLEQAVLYIAAFCGPAARGIPRPPGPAPSVHEHLNDRGHLTDQFVRGMMQ